MTNVIFNHKRKKNRLSETEGFGRIKDVLSLSEIPVHFDPTKLLFQTIVFFSFCEGVGFRLSAFTFLGR